jgi:hypothetical protein
MAELEHNVDPNIIGLFGNAPLKTIMVPAFCYRLGLGNSMVFSVYLTHELIIIKCNII